MSGKWLIKFGMTILFIASLLISGCTNTQDTGWEVPVVNPSGESIQETGIFENQIDTLEKEPITSLSWTGCGIVKNAFMDASAGEYENETGIKIEITGGGATKGIRAPAGGMADIGGTCRIALPERFDEEKVVLTHVAWDALVFVTHNSNPVDSITVQQVKEILTGNITNWKELGGPDENIIPVFRVQTESGKLSGVGYMARVMLFNDSEKNFTQKAIFKQSTGPIEEYVEITPYTFALTGVSSAKKRDFKILKLDGMEPNMENIASEKYPFAKPLYLATKGEPEGEVKKFIDWILSPNGQKVIHEQGTVNLEEGKDLKGSYQYWHNTHIIRNY